MASILKKKETDSAELKIDYHAVKKAALILQSINPKLTQQILQLINQHRKNTVTEIYIKLRLEQSVASQHLAILRKTQIVKTTREGKFIHYSINHDRLTEIDKFVADMLH